METETSLRLAAGEVREEDPKKVFEMLSMLWEYFQQAGNERNDVKTSWVSNELEITYMYIYIYI